jgi:hypothetical protein
MKKDKSENISQHGLFLTRLSTWIRLLRQNRIDPEYRKKAFYITLMVILTFPIQLLQRIIYYPSYRKVEKMGKAPLFVIGHWRSGTTHLHYIMSRDPQFGFVSNYLTFAITMCLIGRGWLNRFIALFVPRTRPQDNVRISIDTPQEEELPLANLTDCVAMHSFHFPRNQSYFRKYNLFQDIKRREKRRWKKAYREMVNITKIYVDHKRLLLKNPNNTGRMLELLEIYPDANFIFIYRNPFEVYRSTVKLFDTVFKTQFLQNISDQEIEEIIFYNYRTIMQRYLEQRKEIPQKQLIEVCYEELEKDPLGIVRQVYDRLELTGFEEAHSHMKEYLKGVKNYRKSPFKELEPRIVQRIQDEWGFAFDAWGYSRDYESYKLSQMDN